VYHEGEWFIDLNGNGVWDEGDLWAKLGTKDDKPVTGDWDGDGKTDIGIYGPAWAGDPRAVAKEPGLPDPHNSPTGARKNIPPRPDEATLGVRHMKRTRGGPLHSDVIDHVFHFGSSLDVPVTGDWTGTGVDSIGIYSDGQWVLDVDGDGKRSEADITLRMGEKGDRPVVGDFDGDGTDELGVYRDGHWHIDINHDGALDERDLHHELGSAGHRPVVGDWDGDGVDQIGVHREEEPTPSET
jgi:serine-aspartate repeat-containing protein C/D/E